MKNALSARILILFVLPKEQVKIFLHQKQFNKDLNGSLQMASRLVRFFHDLAERKFNRDSRF